GQRWQEHHIRRWHAARGWRSVAEVLVVQGHRVLGRRAEVPGRVTVVVVAERGEGLLQLGHVRPALARREVPPGGHLAGQREQRLTVDLGQLPAVGDRVAGGDVQLRYVPRPRRGRSGSRGWTARGRTRRRIRRRGARVHVVLRRRVHHAAHLNRRGKDLVNDRRRGHRGRRRRGVRGELLRRLHEGGADQPADGQQGRRDAHPEQHAPPPGEP